MPESTKIDFQHRRISQLSDFTELIEMLVPGNRNQQHAAAAIFFELKWANCMVPNLAYIQTKYVVSRRVVQRARARLARLGVIEHVSYLSSRYGGQHGWRLSGRFETALRQLAEKCEIFREATASSEEKDRLLLQFSDARRTAGPMIRTGSRAKNRRDLR